MATFNETRAPTSRKYIGEEGIPPTNWSNTFQTFWLHSSVFALEEQPEKLNSQSFFTSKKLFGGYFQWNACTYYQKICSRTRYPNAKLIKNILTFLVALLGFCFTKTIRKAKFSEFFYIKETLWWLLSMKRVHFLPENMWLNKVLRRHIDEKYIKFFGHTPPFLLYKINLKN